MALLGCSRWLAVATYPVWAEVANARRSLLVSIAVVGVGVQQRLVQLDGTADVVDVRLRGIRLIAAVPVVPVDSDPVDDAIVSRTILGLSWATGSAEVRLVDDISDTSTVVAAVGLRLNYRTGPGAARRCLGRTPFRSGDASHVDCLNRPEQGSRLCRQCSISDATFASNLHHAHTKDRATIDPAIAEHLRQPNLLYLAAFRDGSLKVGTTTAKRATKRLAEQGAWRALVVAEASDGYAVREIEDRATEELGLAQSVSIGRKLDGMASPLADARLTEKLLVVASAVDDLRNRIADARLSAHRDEWVFSNAEASVWTGLHRYPMKLTSGQHDLEVVAACGRMVVVQRVGTADTFIVDLGQLYGVELAIGDYESDELAVQDSLF